MRLKPAPINSPIPRMSLEQVKLRVNLLEMLHKQLALRLHALQHLRGINQVKCRPPRRRPAGYRRRSKSVGNWRECAGNIVGGQYGALIGKPPPSALALVRMSGVTP